MTLLAYHWLFDCAPVAKERLEQSHRDMARRPHPPRRHLEAHLWPLPMVDLDDDAFVVDLYVDLVVEVAHQREQNVAVAEDDLAPWGRCDS